MYTLERNRIYDLAQPVSAEFSKGTSSLSSTWLLSTAGILSTADQWVADKSGNENRVLAIYDSANTVRVHETNDDGSTWYPIFERASQIESFGTDADLYGDYVLIGIPTFRNGTGKIESWYLDSEISASTLNTPYSGWNMVTYTNDDIYDGLTGTNTLSSDVGLGFNVGISVDFYSPSGSISSIAAWYDASDTSTINHLGGAVSQWDDKSGNGNNLTQPTGANQPYTGTHTINGINAIRFDNATNTFIYANDDDSLNFDDSGGYTIFFVMHYDDNTTSVSRGIYTKQLSTEPGYEMGIYTPLGLPSERRSIVQYADSPDAPYFDALDMINTNTLVSVVRDDTQLSGKTYINSSLRSSTTLNSTIGDNTRLLVLGADYGVNSSDMHMGEFIIFEGPMEDDDRKQVEGYLAWKWGILDKLPSDHPYKTSLPNTTEPVVIASTSGDNLDFSSLDVFEYNRLYKGNLQVQRFVSTVKVKMVETNHKVKILETGDDGKYNIYDPINGYNIGLIYPSKDFLQSNASGNPKLNQNILGDVKTQAPEGALDQVTQLNNTAITFKEETTENIKYYSFVDGEYQELPNGAVLYNEPTTFDEDYINSLSAPKVVLSGMDYGYFGEMPINDIAYDFDYGELYIDMFNLHNELDYKYDTDAYTDPSTTVANTTDVFLNNTRDYERIGVNENLIWISYRVGQNYQGSIGVSPLPDGYSYDNEAPVLMSKTTETTGTAFDYTYIERFAGANRTSTTAHKSNIYSIEIINSNLNTNIEDEETRSYIQTIVERAILQFQENVAPVHTQLWKIVWKGL